MAATVPSAPRAPADAPALDYRSAFEFAPVAVALSRDRRIVDCNLRMLAMFGAQRDDLVGHTFERLYPTRADFDRTGLRILAGLDVDGDGEYSDERVMRRVRDGSLFWCHVSGHAFDRAHPHAACIWSFEDISSSRQNCVDMTPREREIGALLVEGLTSKLAAKRLGLSPRTVEIYRRRLMRKHGVGTATGLVRKLMNDEQLGANRA
jgi:PAS domain S-box-containing protein